MGASNKKTVKSNTTTDIAIVVPTHGQTGIAVAVDNTQALLTQQLTEDRNQRQLADAVSSYAYQLGMSLRERLTLVRTQVIALKSEIDTNFVQLTAGLAAEPKPAFPADVKRFATYAKRIGHKIEVEIKIQSPDISKSGDTVSLRLKTSFKGAYAQLAFDGVIERPWSPQSLEFVMAIRALEAKKSEFEVAYRADTKALENIPTQTEAMTQEVRLRGLNSDDFGKNLLSMINEGVAKTMNANPTAKRLLAIGQSK